MSELGDTVPLSEMFLEISNSHSRKRIQNRMAQRRHRSKIKNNTEQNKKATYPSSAQTDNGVIQSQCTVPPHQLAPDNYTSTSIGDGRTSPIITNQKSTNPPQDINQCLTSFAPTDFEAAEQTTQTEDFKINSVSNPFLNPFSCLDFAEQDNFTPRPEPSVGPAQSSNLFDGLIGSSIPATLFPSVDEQSALNSLRKELNSRGNTACLYQGETDRRISSSPAKSLQHGDLSAAPLLETPNACVLSQNVTERFQSLLTVAKCLGFSSFDDVICQYYTAEFTPESVPCQEQHCSRQNRFQQMLVNISKASTSWTLDGNSLFHDEVVTSAEKLLCEEIESVTSRLDAIRKLAGLVEINNKQETTSVTQARNNHLDQEIYRMLHDALPRLSSLLTSLQRAANGEGSDLGAVGRVLACLVCSSPST